MQSLSDFLARAGLAASPGRTCLGGKCGSRSIWELWAKANSQSETLEIWGLDPRILSFRSGCLLPDEGKQLYVYSLTMPILNSCPQARHKCAWASYNKFLSIQSGKRPGVWGFGL